MTHHALPNPRSQNARDRTAERSSSTSTGCRSQIAQRAKPAAASAVSTCTAPAVLRSQAGKLLHMHDSNKHQKGGNDAGEVGNCTALTAVRIMLACTCTCMPAISIRKEGSNAGEVSNCTASTAARTMLACTCTCMMAASIRVKRAMQMS